MVYKSDNVLECAQAVARPLHRHHPRRAGQDAGKRKEGANWGEGDRTGDRAHVPDVLRSGRLPERRRPRVSIRRRSTRRREGASLRRREAGRRGRMSAKRNATRARRRDMDARCKGKQGQ